MAVTLTGDQGFAGLPIARAQSGRLVLEGALREALGEDVRAWLLPRRGGVRTAIELFHNGALVHDDIEDISDFRRGSETLFRRHGVPIAINAGDATFVLCLSLLLTNVERLGVRKALRILSDFERLSRESVEGQAIELDWIRHDRFDLGTGDYLRMACKKTCWYTMIAPLRLGVIAGSGPGFVADLEDALIEVIEPGYLAGIGFQIQDDLLNLTADKVVYGKEISGDLFEGKRTVMLLHFLREAPEPLRRRAGAALPSVAAEGSDGGALASDGDARGGLDRAWPLRRP